MSFLVVDKNVVFVVPSGNTKVLQDFDFNRSNDTEVKNENNP